MKYLNKIKYKNQSESLRSEKKKIEENSKKKKKIEMQLLQVEYEWKCNTFFR